MKRSKLRSHKNPRPSKKHCRCPFGQGEPYVSKKDQEHYGAKEAMWHDAAKYDWLKSREDIKSNSALDWAVEVLKREHPEHDSLYPWLIREIKKDRLQHKIYHHNEGYIPLTNEHANVLAYGTQDDPDFLEQQHQNNPTAFQFSDHNGMARNLTQDSLDQIADWMKYQKQAKKGIDIMQHDLPTAIRKAEKNDLGGEVVHTFDNGYNVVRLRNKRDMVREGDTMNHCIGSNGMGYIEKNDDGEGLYYSLRTPDNEPIGTAELEKTSDEYYKCPSCSQFTSGRDQTNYSGNDIGRLVEAKTVCPNDGTTLKEMDPETRVWKSIPGVESFPVKLDPHKPSAEVSRISQMFGPNDHLMDAYHEEMFNQFFGKHGHTYYNSDGEGEEGYEEDYEPWWENSYDLPEPTNADHMLDYLNQHTVDYAPDEWEQASNDADEHGLESPDLEMPDPSTWDLDTIFQDLASEDVDPERIKTIWNTIEKSAPEILPEWNNLAREWLDREYNSYLDPYGQEDAYTQTIPPSTPVAPGTPDAHYPATHPGEEYFARNLKHHLEKYRDPLTGEQHDSLHELAVDSNPPFHRKHDPIFDIWDDDKALPADPYGPRDPEELDWSQRSGLGVDQTYKGPYQREFEGEEGSHVRPFTERETDDPSYWEVGNRQRMMFPMGWYVDHKKRNLQQSDLPEHLFPPTNYSRPISRINEARYDRFADPGVPGQMPMWHNKRIYTPETDIGTTPGALLNTQVEPPTGAPVPGYNDQGDRNDGRPVGWWQASTKEAGPWTDVEAQPEGRERPVPRDDGYGVFPGVDVPQTIPHMNGRVIEYNGNLDNAFLMPEFSWRIPVVHDRHDDRFYVGKQAMEHGDMMKMFHHPSPYSDFGRYNPGYIDVGGQVGGGAGFYNNNNDIPPEFHDWVAQRFNTRSSETPPVKDEDIEWSNSQTTD